MNPEHDWNLAILPPLDADGATQMGLDLALLDHAHEDPSTIWWRTYTWSRPTLSLGYFQVWHEALPEVRNVWNGYEIVRRPSGGGAIVHHGDVTYAIVVPSGHPWCGHARSLYQAVHDSIGQLMTEDGAEVSRRQTVSAPNPANSPISAPGTTALRTRASRRPSPFLCFEDGDADDLVLDGVKIVGGAQRRRGWATLQHGSIRWKSAGSGPGSAQPGLIDLRPEFRSPNPMAWAAGLGERLASAWNLPVRKVGMPAEVVLAGHAWSRRIRDREWLEKR